MKGEAYLEVWCDKCNCQEYILLTATARGWDDRSIDNDLKSMGWQVDGDNTLCETCKENENGK